MERPVHYVEVRVLPLDGSAPSGGDVAFVMSKLMHCVHKHIVDGHEVAVSFPEFRTEAGDGGLGIGSRIRVFGSHDSLMAILVRKEFAQLVGSAAISTGSEPIRSVPEGCRWEIFQRWRSPEKQCEGFVLRAARRKLRRKGEADYPVFHNRKGKLPPYFFMDSASTGQRFRIFLKRMEAEGHVPGKVSAYGLGVPVPAW